MRWQGTYKEVEAVWLRWATQDGVLLATPEEQAEQRAEQERHRAEQAERRAEQLAAQLRAMGIEPEGES